MTVTPAVRAWARYLVPLTVLSGIAGAGFAWLALRAGAPADLDEARALLRLGWVLAGSAWAVQLVLVAAVTPAVRSVVRGAPVSQASALADGARALVRGLVPCTVAVAAVVLGGLALALPGLALLGLFAMTGASEQLGDPLPAPLVDAARVARANLARIAAVLAAVVAADLAIALVAQLVLIHGWPKKPPIEMLVSARTFVRVVALALLAVSPLSACAIAAIYERRR